MDTPSEFWNYQNHYCVSDAFLKDGLCSHFFLKLLRSPERAAWGGVSPTTLTRGWVVLLISPCFKARQKVWTLHCHSPSVGARGHRGLRDKAGRPHSPDGGAGGGQVPVQQHLESPDPAANQLHQALHPVTGAGSGWYCPCFLGQGQAELAPAEGTSFSFWRVGMCGGRLGALGQMKPSVLSRELGGRARCVQPGSALGGRQAPLLGAQPCRSP